MKKDTVIFDLDGTLLNSLGDIHAGFNYAMKSCGYKECSMEEVKAYVGNGIKKAFERAIPECREELTEKLVLAFKSYYINHLNELTTPYDGIMDMLKELKEKHYSMAIVSNKYDDAVKELCKNYFPDYISVAVGESAKIKRKPSIDGIIIALGQLGKGLENVIYVGDSEVDIKTAENAGVPCISALWGFKDKEYLENFGGKLFAEKPGDIIKIIENFI